MGSKEFSAYLTYGDEDERWQLVCVDAGRAEVGPGSPYPPAATSHPAEHRSVATGRTVGEYQLVYVTRGKGDLRTASLESPLSVAPGDVILVFPGVHHSYRPDPAVGWTERWVGFKGPWADALRREGLINPSRPLYSPGLDGEVLDLFEELFAILAEQRPFYQARAASVVMRLLAEILGKSRDSEQEDDAARLVSRAKFLMAEKVYGSLSVDGVGEELGVAHVRFYGVFKSYTGLTPYQYFIQLKIHKAKELLSGGATVKEAAFRLGFDDPYYFSRLFKKKAGVAPREWK